MPKIEDGNRVFLHKSTVMMVLDIDIDNYWTFDQIFPPDPTSPFLLAPEQLCSPLWAFSDEAPREEGRAMSSSCNPDLATEGLSRNDDVRKIPPPVLGFMPLEYSDGTCVIKERMMQALRYFKESTEQHVLVQLWVPVKSGGSYMFSVDGESDGGLGLPGRDFRQKFPEWTPNVQYYSSKEFPRLNHALHYGDRGTLALPVEPYGKTCVNVFEIIMTSQKVNYAPKVDKVCKALEAVNLKSSDILDQRNTDLQRRLPKCAG